MGWKLAGIGLAYVWIAFALFQKLKTKEYLASSITLLLAIVTNMCFDVVCAQMLHTNVFNVWDIVNMVVTVVFAGILYIVHIIKNKDI